MPTLSDREIAGHLVAAGFPRDQVATGVAVILAESSGRTDAFNAANRNGSWDAGLMQVNSIHGKSREYLMDPGNNVREGFRIWTAAGRRWSPWSVYNNGRYRAFLPRGAIAAGAPTTPSGGGVTVPVDNAAPALNPFAVLMDGGTWLRVGMALLGGLALIFSLVKMTGVGSTVVRVAASRVPIARAVKI